MKSTDLEMAANDTRKRWGIGPEQGIDILQVLWQLEHISIVRCPLAEDSALSGLYVRKGDSVVILLNSARSLGHQHFTAAHEFYHVRHGKPAEGRVCKAALFNEREQEERDADEYAANLLIPAAGLRHIAHLHNREGRIDLHTVMRLEQYFRVSRRAMLWRLRSLGMITKKAYSELLSAGAVSEARRCGYDTQLYTSPRDFQVLSDIWERVREAEERQLISRGRATEILLNWGYDCPSETGVVSEHVD